MDKKITLHTKKEPERVIHIVLDAGVGENQPFSARLLTQVHPLTVPEPGDAVCQAGEPQLYLSVPTLLSWDCCGYPKHRQAFSQVCLFGDVFSRNITKHFGLREPNAILTSERQKQWKRMVSGTLWNNVFLLVRGKKLYTTYRQHT